MIRWAQSGTARYDPREQHLQIEFTRQDLTENSILIPEELQETELTVRIRLKGIAGVDPTVHLRHFR